MYASLFFEKLLVFKGYFPQVSNLASSCRYLSDFHFNIWFIKDTLGIVSFTCNFFFTCPQMKNLCAWKLFISRAASANICVISVEILFYNLLQQYFFKHYSWYACNSFSSCFKGKKFICLSQPWIKKSLNVTKFS